MKLYNCCIVDLCNFLITLSRTSAEISLRSVTACSDFLKSCESFWAQLDKVVDNDVLQCRHLGDAVARL